MLAVACYTIASLIAAVIGIDYKSLAPDLQTSLLDKTKEHLTETGHKLLQGEY